jgi:dienelactone hydrolase
VFCFWLPVFYHHGALFKPDGDGPFPAVVLMHGCGWLQQPVRAAMSSHAEYLVRLSEI